MTDPTDQARDRLAGSFGYQEVRPEHKSALVGEVFARVAARYDLMNDLMSAGVHRLWKAALIDWLAPRPGLRLLDVAGGTGDIAFRVLDRVARRGAGPPRIIVCDVNTSMLEVGRDRAIDANRLDAIDWVCADAEALPLPERSVDAYTIAFGIRNVTRIDRALAEAKRVLVPGGRAPGLAVRGPGAHLCGGPLLGLRRCAALRARVGGLGGWAVAAPATMRC